MTPATILFKSFVTLLNVAGPCLYRRALASVVEAVTGTTTLLNSIATCAEQEVHSDQGDQPSSAESLGQHRGQHSPSGTVALEQGMMGQDTFLQMVTEFWQ